MIELREVAEPDLEPFFEHQTDSEASAMAAFPSRDRAAHLAHWRRTLADPTGIARTVVVDGEVAGNVVSWQADGRRLVGYWIGREFWGRGVATAALRAFVLEVGERPLHAWVATANVGSIRVLENAGFEVDPLQPTPRSDDDVEERLYRLG